MKSNLKHKAICKIHHEEKNLIENKQGWLVGGMEPFMRM